MFFAKRQAPVEAINDLNGDLIHMWMTLRDSPLAFIRRVRSLPYSRELFQSWNTQWARGWRPDDPLERAVIYYYLNRNAFNGNIGHGWQAGPRDNGAKKFRGAINRLRPAAARLARTVIDRQDFEAFITTWDDPKTLFYVDPPYFQENLYDVPWADNDHERLARMLGGVKAKVALSYQPVVQLDRLYPGWRRIEIIVPRYSTPITARNPVSVKETMTELVLTNYEPSKQLRLSDGGW